jgi:hypothetical protein
MNLIRRDPCELCEDRKTVRSLDYYQPDEVICLVNGTDVFECDRTQIVERLADVAEKVAASLATIDDEVMRKEVAESTADGFSNALYEQDRSAEFDTVAFCALVERLALVEVRP